MKTRKTWQVAIWSIRTWTGLIIGDLNRTKAFLNVQPNALSAKIPPLGQTALEIAVAFEHVHIVEELATRALEQNLENQANGYETTMTEAVLVAFRCGKLEMARTLFSALIGHSQRNLTIENGGNSNINECTDAIYTKNFGIVYELIKRFPSLVDARDSEGNTPLMTLASIPDAFPSRNRIVFWKGWIYKYCNYHDFVLRYFI
ncbi:hypothetical protein CJ030_MR1G015682 [Morella rubra]|uniref:Uncharacterized protein n=1 Tax=Morella rubra TaxID=262757 RepID=A0A6A1WNR5_9ROSI|nr:hypothetical protein CJ030_MR1G015682 [Morella rubra]